MPRAKTSLQARRPQHLRSGHRKSLLTVQSPQLLLQSGPETTNADSMLSVHTDPGAPPARLSVLFNTGTSLCPTSLRLPIPGRAEERNTDLLTLSNIDATSIQTRLLRHPTPVHFPIPRPFTPTTDIHLCLSTLSASSAPKAALLPLKTFVF